MVTERIVGKSFGAGRTLGREGQAGVRKVGGVRGGFDGRLHPSRQRAPRVSHGHTPSTANSRGQGERNTRRIRTWGNEHHPAKMDHCWRGQTTRPFGGAPPSFLARRHMHRLVPLFVTFGEVVGVFGGGRAIRLLAAVDSERAGFFVCFKKEVASATTVGFS